MDDSTSTNSFLRGFHVFPVFPSLGCNLSNNTENVSVETYFPIPPPTLPISERPHSMPICTYSSTLAYEQFMPPGHSFPPQVPQVTHSDHYFPLQVQHIPHSVSGNFHTTPITKNTNLKSANEEGSELCFLQNQYFCDLKKRVIDASHLKLSNVSARIRKFYRSVRELETLMGTLKSCLLENEENWKYLRDKALIKKVNLIELKEFLEFTPESLRIITVKVNLRKKKRRILKKNNFCKKSIVSKYEITNRHLQYLIQTIDKIEQEDKLKKEADNILFSVIQKKIEARNQINLLTAIQKLHSARMTAISNEKNYQILNSMSSGFRNVIGKLNLFWEVKMNEYQIEENGLNVVLKELSVNAEDEECKNLNKISGNWLKFLFGTIEHQEQSFYSNYEDFISIRQGWDKFVTVKSTTSSKIPGGWVVPRYNSDVTWRKFVN